MVDLHTHTSASDGQYAPADFVRKAAENHVTVLAVTDHDTVAALPEAAAAAEKSGVTFVPGVELNIERPGCEFHLLGLGLYHIAQSFFDLIEQLQKNRLSRNLEIVEKMNADGVKTSLEEIQDEFPGRILGRPHFAEWLARHSVVKNPQQAFDRFLGRGRPWFADKKGAALDDAVAAVRASGGVPVIAHPLSLYLSWKNLEPALAEFHAHGVLGLEAYHPGARENDCARLERMARALGFFVTAGSDFHGEDTRRDRKIGRTCGGRQIDDRFWTEELKPALEKYSV